MQVMFIKHNQDARHAGGEQTSNTSHDRDEVMTEKPKIKEKYKT